MKLGMEVVRKPQYFHPPAKMCPNICDAALQTWQTCSQSGLENLNWVKTLNKTRRSVVVQVDHHEGVTRESGHFSAC